MQCTVIGAGVVGLSSAIRLREAGNDVHVVARELPPRTTSSVAAAFWYPYHASPSHRVARWALASHATYTRLESMPGSGITMRTTVEVSLGPTERPDWSRGVPDFQAARRADLPPAFEYGWAWRGPVIDTRGYMPWLLERAASTGVSIERRDLRSLEEVEGDVIVNCTGLGAGPLVPDPRVHPIRGQLVHVANPGLEHVLIDETIPGEITYAVPRGDDVVLGGTTEPRRSDRTADDEDTRSILERCARLVPGIEDAARLAVVVGLRPGRPEVRLEREDREGMVVIHNYGHGGAGVTLSWGCAAEVLELADERRRGS